MRTIMDEIIADYIDTLRWQAKVERQERFIDAEVDGLSNASCASTRWAPKPNPRSQSCTK